mmetsp:Transcript_73167/g.174378  ORF Transcript_73167/g.174378 Transcript_73167/m.174378 type:complete len:328 (-) Transcript_73167:465-1448(-)
MLSPRGPSPSPSPRGTRQPIASELAKEWEFVSGHDSCIADRWFLIEAGWLKRWRQYVTKGGEHPGPISNHLLLDPRSHFTKPRAQLVVKKNYRGTTAEVWQYLLERYGSVYVIESPYLDIHITDVVVRKLEQQQQQQPTSPRRQYTMGSRKKAGTFAYASDASNQSENATTPETGSPEAGANHHVNTGSSSNTLPSTLANVSTATSGNTLGSSLANVSTISEEKGCPRKGGLAALRRSFTSLGRSNKTQRSKSPKATTPRDGRQPQQGGVAIREATTIQASPRLHPARVAAPECDSQALTGFAGLPPVPATELADQAQQVLWRRFSC